MSSPKAIKFVINASQVVILHNMLFFLCSFASLIWTPTECFGNTAWPMDLKTPFSYPTYAPVNIVTSLARPINTSAPLEILVQLSQPVLVCNTGKYVQVKPKCKGFTSVRGGFLGNDVYDFGEMQFLWSADPIKSFGSDLDNRGAPIMIALIFYNRRYGSLSSASWHRDGSVILVAKLGVQGHIGDSSFVEFESSLKQITTSGKCVESTFQKTTYFIAHYDNAPYYYAFPGANYVRFQPEPQQTFSATIIDYEKTDLTSISLEQFKAFQNLKNSFGSPVDSSLASYSLGGRPLVQAPILTHKFLP